MVLTDPSQTASDTLPLSWPFTYQEAVAWQESRRHEVNLTPLGRLPRLVAGADCAYDRLDKRIYAAVAVFTFPGLELVEEIGLAQDCPFPYIPGLLSFREAPAIMAAWGQLKGRAEVLLLDGQGIAHPRGLGLASHVGILLKLPTIGVAKSRLVGEGLAPGRQKGAYSGLCWQGKQVGCLVRSREGKKPLYVSPGHLLTLEEAREITLACVSRYRLPTPLRQADLLSRRLRVAAQTQVTGKPATAWKTRKTTAPGDKGHK